MSTIYAPSPSRLTLGPEPFPVSATVPAYAHRRADTNQSRFRSQNAADPAELLPNVVNTAKEVAEVAELLRHRSEQCAKVCNKARAIVFALESMRATDIVGPLVKTTKVANNDLERTLADLETIARTELHVSVSPSGSPPTATQRPANLWRRVQHSMIVEFAIARCEERLTHLLRELTVHGVAPPAYDDPATRIPDQVQLRVWDRARPIDAIVAGVFGGRL